MSTTTSAVTTGLDSYFQTLINSTMHIEAQKLTSLQTKQTNLNTQKSLYSTLQSKFTSLQSATQALVSKDAFYAVSTGRTSSITPYGDKATFTATTTSKSLAGDYNIAIDRLAVAHSVRGTQQVSAATALNLSGDIYVGGLAGGPQVTTSYQNSNVLSAISTVADTTASGALDDDVKQLGDGTYRIETRKQDGVWQFRLVDADTGSAVSIRSGTDTETQTSSWQNITSGAYDTGRGLTLNFADPSTYADTDQGVSGEITYKAQGSKVSVAATDTLADIAEKIRNATYADGNTINATIVDRRLILTAKNTGRDMVVSETGNVLQNLGIFDSGGAFVAANETKAQTAHFTVNGIDIIRRSNTNLNNVVEGVTLNLTGKQTDYTTQSDTLTVAEDTSNIKTAVQSFIDKFNDILSYLKTNTTSTKNDDGTYSRGGLSGDTVFYDVRSNFLTSVSSSFGSTYQRTNTPTGATGDTVTLGSLKSLRDIGITLDDSLNLSISDEDKFEEALTDHLSDVKSLLDASMGSIDDQIGRFTGTWGDYGSSVTGYMSSASTNLSSQLTEMTTKINDEEDRLTTKQATLVQQYAEIQTNLLSLQAMQTTWKTIYGYTSS
jgi:flagellar hook-associated protein 2